MKWTFSGVFFLVVACGGDSNVGDASVPDAGDRDAAVAPDPMASPRLTVGATIVGTVTAADGSLYLAGRLNDPFDFGNGVVDPGVSGSDILLVRYTPEGTLDWVKNFGDLESNFAAGVDVDAAGNVYIAGSLRGTADFGNGVRGDTPTSTDIFVASFEPNGAHRWDRVVASPGNGADVATGLAVGEGNVYVIGRCEADTDFGGGSLGNRSNARYYFTAALDKNTGAHVWSEGHPLQTDFGSNPSAEFRSIALDAQENLFVAGYFKGRIDLGSGDIDSSELPFGERLLRTETGFVVSYTGAGAYRWLTLQDGDNLDRTASVAVDTAGNVYALGEFTTSADLGGGTVSDPEASSIPTNVFYVSYSNTGAYRFHGGVRSQAGSTANSSPGGITTTPTAVYLAFNYRGVMEFSGQVFTSVNNPESFRSQDVAVASLALDDGALRWARSYGGSGDERAGRVSQGGGMPLVVLALDGVITVDDTTIEPTTASETNSLLSISE